MFILGLNWICFLTFRAQRQYQLTKVSLHKHSPVSCWQKKCMSVVFDMLVKKVRGQDHKRKPSNSAPSCDKTVDDAWGFSLKGSTFTHSFSWWLLSVEFSRPSTELIRVKPEKETGWFSSSLSLSLCLCLVLAPSPNCLPDLWAEHVVDLT